MVETGSRRSPAPPVPRSPLAYAASIYAALLLFGLTVLGFFLLLRLQYLLIVLFLAALVASGIAGPVRRLERRRVPRGVAILLVYLLIVGVLALVAWYVLPRLAGQATDLAATAPERVRETEQLRERLRDLGRDYPVLRDVDTRLLAAANGAAAEVTSRVLAIPGAIARVLFALTSVFTIASLLLLTKERLLGLILSLTHPRHRALTERVLVEMSDRMGAYLRAKAIVIVIIGSLVWATLFFLGSAYAVITGIFAGLVEALPRIGPWIGRAAILIAVLPLGWQAAAIAMVAHVVIENLKGYVISPLVEADQVEIHPLTAFVAIIAGGVLLGWLGALIAVPLAAATQVVVEHVLIPWRRARLAPAEAAFLAAGESAVGPPPTPPDVPIRSPVAPGPRARLSRPVRRGGLPRAGT